MNDYSGLIKDPARKMIGETILSVWESQYGLTAFAQKTAAGDMRRHEIKESATAWQVSAGVANIKAQDNRSPWTSDDFAALSTEAAQQFVIKLWPGMIKDLGWTRQLVVPDFKNYPITVFMPPPLVEIGESEKYTKATPAITINARTALSTWGTLLNLSERLYANDRNGIFLSIGQQLALAAAEKLADVCFGIFTENPTMEDGQPWLSTEAGNRAATLGAGAGAFSADTLGAAITGLRTQTANGLKISLAPRYLLIDPIYEMTARQLTAQYFQKDELTLISDSRMTGLGFAMIADPAKFPVIGRITLGDNGHPTVEVLSVPGSAGLMLRARADFGITPMSRTGIYWMART